MKWINIFISFFVTRNTAASIKSINCRFSRIAILAIVISLLCFSFVFGAKGSDIKILNSDANILEFVISLDDLSSCLEYSTNDSAVYFSRSVMIGVPPGKNLFLTGATGMESGPVNPSSYGQIVTPNHSLVETGEIKNIRGRKIATLNIYPYYQQNFYKEIKITVNFESTGQALMSRIFGTDKIFDRIFASTIINYEQFKNWPVSKRQITGKIAENIFSKSNEWYKIVTASEGFIRITGNQLAAAGLSLGVLSDSIHIYYSGGGPLPIENDIARPELSEIAIRVFDGGDNVFDGSDYLEFFAQAVDDWRYPADSTPYFSEHSYTNLNCYWLAVSGDFNQAGKRMVSIDVNPNGTPDSVISTGRFYMRRGENKLFQTKSDGHVYDFFRWYWTDQSPFGFNVSLPNAASNGGDAEVHLAAQASSLGLTVRGIAATFVSSAYSDFYFTADNLIPGSNMFSVIMPLSSSSVFDYCEVAYDGDLFPSGDILDFSIRGGFGLGEIIIDDRFSSAPNLYDLSDIYNPEILLTDSMVSGNILLQVDMSNPDFHRYYLCPPSKYFSAVSIENYSPVDIRNASQTDLIIIAPDPFMSQMSDYKNYREVLSGINVKLVTVEEIFNQFGFGIYDPTAIRDYLKFAYENFPTSPPSGVLIVGDACYDYENNLNLNGLNVVPTYINGLSSSSSDDNYVYFGDFGELDGDSTYCDTCDNRGYDMMISRWPVNSATDLDIVLDKIMGYETAPNYGAWRTTITLVADDEYTGSTLDRSEHTKQTEILQRDYVPLSMKRNKIYLWEYTNDSYGDKPGAKADIIKAINDGTLIINYVGHGNPDTWSHEHVFNRNSDLTKLNNADKLTLFFTASCSIGSFDSPYNSGMAEELFRLPQAGAIGVVSASRLVFSDYNAGFNREVFDYLFSDDNLSICQAIFAGKMSRQFSSTNQELLRNDRKYEYFGDPFLKLGQPQYNIRFISYPDSLMALNLHQISGEIVDSLSGSRLDMDGSVEISVYDSDILKVHNGVIQTLSYNVDGPLIFRGEARVTDGYFEFSFIAPLDIGYAGTGAKISAYAQSAVADASGLLDSLPISNDIVQTSDSSGPIVQYSFSDRKSFVSGDRIAPDEILMIRLTDTLSGLNLAGSAGHAITLIIDDNVENMVNLTDLFEYDLGSYISGEIRYDFGGLSSGEHKFKVKAWDNANNSTSLQFVAYVVEGGKMILSDLLNYPNPMNEETTFSFAISAQANMVSLEIFTLSGNRIFRYEESELSADYHEFYTWNGRDSDGDRVAAGIYIYKVCAVSTASDEVCESYGKVVLTN